MFVALRFHNLPLTTLHLSSRSLNLVVISNSLTLIWFKKMEPFTFYLVFFTTLVVSRWISSAFKRKINLPGPTGLPIVGYFPFLSSKPCLKLVQLSETYGPLYKIRLGSKDVVVACGYEEIREALENENFLERPEILSAPSKEQNFRSDAGSFKLWKERKRISQQILRDIGVGKISGETVLQEEITEMLKRLQASDTRSVYLRPYIIQSVFKGVILWLFGKKVSEKNPFFLELHEAVERGQYLSPLSWQRYFPWIQKIGSLLRVYSFLKPVAKMRNIILSEMKHHEEAFDKNYIGDLLDGYYLQFENKEENANPLLRDAVLEDLSLTFLRAGTRPVTSFIEWVLLVVAAFPDVQDRIQGELDAVFGQESFPSYRNRLTTPYLEAVISETFRWISMISVNSPRMSKVNFEFRGYWIPKNTLFLAVFHGIHRDKNLFGDDVDVFRPERFLSKDCQKYLNLPFFMPFSVGSRDCPGKTHAKAEVYLYIAAILQKFRISPLPGEEIDLKDQLAPGKIAKRRNLYLELRQ